MSDRLRFAEFELDLRSRELRKRGMKWKLSGQPIEVLAMLLERPGDMISRQELRTRLWPSDTFVDFEHSLNTAVSKLREALGDAARPHRLMETLPRRGYRFLAPVEAVPATSTVPATSGTLRLAVLPFENLSGDPAQEYFSDGMTEELITQLACLHPGQLQIIARTSVMRYKGASKPLGQIASELGVAYVLEGSVRRTTQRVRITAQLIETRGQCHLWAQSYDREPHDILDVQAEVAGAVARAIDLKLTPQQQARIGRVRATNPEAHEAYLRGRYHWNRWSPQDLVKGIEYFQQACTSDPHFAPAFAGLADSYTLLGFLGMAAPRELYAKIRGAAEEALSLDSTLADGHISMGWSRMVCDYDWPEAERAFQRALELNPGSASVRFYTSIFLSAMSRHDEAIAEARRAKDLDPLSPLMHTNLAWRFLQAGRYDDAIQQLHETLDLDPNFPVAHFNLGEALVQMGMAREALVEFQKAESLTGDAPMLGLLAHAYATAHRPAEARRVLKTTLARAKTCFVPPYFLATAYLALGKKDDAFSWLEKAYEARDSWLIFLNVDYRLEPLIGEARFQDLRHRLGLASC